MPFIILRDRFHLTDEFTNVLLSDTLQTSDVRLIRSDLILAGSFFSQAVMESMMVRCSPVALS